MDAAGVMTTSVDADASGHMPAHSLHVLAEVHACMARTRAATTHVASWCVALQPGNNMSVQHK